MTRQKKRRDSSTLTSGSSDLNENHHHQGKRVKRELSANDGKQDFGSVRMILFLVNLPSTINYEFTHCNLNYKLVFC